MPYNAPAITLRESREAVRNRGGKTIDWPTHLRVRKSSRNLVILSNVIFSAVKNTSSESANGFFVID